MTWTTEQFHDEWLLLQDGDYRASTPYRELAITFAMVCNEHEAWVAAMANAGPAIREAVWRPEGCQVLQFPLRTRNS